MPEHSDSLRRKLGITRRDLLRRGIIVGGALIWTVPVLESLKPNAFAHESSPGKFFCCFCSKKDEDNNHHGKTKCIPSAHTASQCANACHSFGFERSKFFSGPNPFTCTKRGCRTQH